MALAIPEGWAFGPIPDESFLECNSFSFCWSVELISNLAVNGKKLKELVYD